MGLADGEAWEREHPGTRMCTECLLCPCTCTEGPSYLERNPERIAARELRGRLNREAKAIRAAAPVVRVGVNPKDAIGVRKVPSTVVSAVVVGEIGLGMLEGALKYGRHNYRVVDVRASVYIDAAKRHLDAWWEGEDIDPESGLSHLSKAMSSLAVVRDAMIQGTWADDRPPPSPEGWQAELNTHAARIMAKYPEPKQAYLACDAPPKK